MPEANEPVQALILFGPPGSGKGTQAKLIRDCLSIPHISTGDMLRERMAAGDGLGLVIKQIVDQGELVTDDLVNRMVEERIQRPDCARGFILDGYPRTISQAASMRQRLSDQGIGWVVVHLKVDYNVIIRRLAGRRSCVKCGAVYNVMSNPPKVLDVCDVCGSPLQTRDDDGESVIRKRLEAYEAQTRPLLEFFSEEGSLHEVDGVGNSPDVIAAQICGIVRMDRDSTLSRLSV